MTNVEYTCEVCDEDTKELKELQVGNWWKYEKMTIEMCDKCYNAILKGKNNDNEDELLRLDLFMAYLQGDKSSSEDDLQQTKPPEDEQDRKVYEKFKKIMDEAEKK